MSAAVSILEKRIAELERDNTLLRAGNESLTSELMKAHAERNRVLDENTRHIEARRAAADALRGHLDDIAAAVMLAKEISAARDELALENDRLVEALLLLRSAIRYVDSDALAAAMKDADAALDATRKAGRLP